MLCILSVRSDILYNLKKFYLEDHMKCYLITHISLVQLFYIETCNAK